MFRRLSDFVSAAPNPALGTLRTLHHRERRQLLPHLVTVDEIFWVETDDMKATVKTVLQFGFVALIVIRIAD